MSSILSLKGFFYNHIKFLLDDYKIMDNSKMKPGIKGFYADVYIIQQCYSFVSIKIFASGHLSLRASPIVSTDLKLPGEFKAPSTRIRIFLKTHLFFIRFGFPSTQRRRFQSPKTKLFQNALQSGSF